MALKVFRLFDHVQDVSCRNFIMAQVLQAGFDKASTVNVSDASGKWVEIIICGEESRIRNFTPKLESELRNEFGDGIVLKEMQANGTEEPPDIMRTSQAHLMLQFRKATDILQKELGGIHKQLEKLDGRMETLPERIANNLNDKLGMLPERIAEAIARHRTDTAH